MHGYVSKDKTLQVNDMTYFAEPDNPSVLIQNLVSFPTTVQRYNNREAAAKESETTFAYEDPKLLSYEALEPTSGRKNWKIKHHKRVKRKLKTHNNGFIGEP